MTVYSVKSPHNYAYSSTIPAAIQTKHGFKSITIGGKKFYEFRYAGFTTHCRPIAGGLQVYIIGINGGILEIHQSNHEGMVNELKVALMTILKHSPWPAQLAASVAHLGGGLYRSQCPHCDERFQGEYTPTSNFANTHHKWQECQRS